MQGMSKNNVEEYGVWTLSNSKYFIWQQGAWCHRDDCVDFDTLVSFFDVSLEDLGWQRINLESYNPCFGVLRETDFIYDGVLNGLYIGYRPDADGDDIPSPIVCIALWSEGEFYKVKVMTRVVSLRTRIYSSFD